MRNTFYGWRLAGFRGLEELFEVNSDRFLLILIILAALAAVGIMGFEYAQPTFVEHGSAMANTMI